MRTVPLHGKKAAGRVALVDDGDYDLVMQYRWYVWEPKPRPGYRPGGPYAITSGGTRMHCLIMGVTGIDHENHDGLDNRRSNLRPATHAQNGQNARPRLAGSSQYKGVCRVRRGMWRAYITVDGRRRTLGDFVSELQAAYVYDEAARESFGEFACTNFPEGPTLAMQDEWRADREEREAQMAAERSRANRVAGKTTWERRQPEARICKVCGDEYWSRSTNSLYCGYKCRKKAGLPAEAQRKRDKRAGERLAAAVSAKGGLS